MDHRTNTEWKDDLKRTSPHFEEAVRDLRELIMKGLGSGLSGRRDARGSFLEDVAQETVLRIVDRIDSFEGKSRFSTWALKVGVRVALTELRHRRWKDVSLDEILARGGFDMPLLAGKSKYLGPEARTIQKELMATLTEVIDKELTENQRKALVAIRFHGMPLSEVAERMGTNRNALYKLLYDARLAVKRAIIKQGLTPTEVLEVFQT
jgi:RNA polymerase sigma-70 factor (ECF subfamily)